MPIAEEESSKQNENEKNEGKKRLNLNCYLKINFEMQ